MFCYGQKGKLRQHILLIGLTIKMSIWSFATALNWLWPDSFGYGGLWSSYGRQKMATAVFLLFGLILTMTYKRRMSIKCWATALGQLWLYSVSYGGLRSSYGWQRGATATYSANWPCKSKKTVYGNGVDKLSYGEKLAMAHFSGYGGLKCLAMASKGRLRQLILLFGWSEK